MSIDSSRAPARVPAAKHQQTNESLPNQEWRKNSTRLTEHLRP